MREKKHKLKTLIQKIYITWNTFSANDLTTYASAGAYSFLLSALPILLMVLAILLRLFNTSPEVIRNFIGSNALFTNSLDFSFFLDSVMSIKSVGIFEIIIGISVFGMARKFFTSIQGGIKIIYKKRGKGKAFKENLVLLAGEAMLIIMIVVLTIFILAGNALLATEIGAHMLSPMLFTMLKYLFLFAPLLLLGIFLFLVYFIAPPIHPKAGPCLFASCGCTVSLTLVQVVFTAFINMSKYNLVYGILSNIIVTLLQVYLFFFLFLFFAQFLYVGQFFESFLFARIYLLPSYKNPDFFKQIERTLFIDPPLFYKRYALRKKTGDVIFARGENSTELYYLWQGAVTLNLPNQVIELKHGMVFGEFASIVGGARTATAVAHTDVVLLKIPSRIFQETIKVDGEMSRKTLQMISDYVRKKNEDGLSTEL